MTGLVETALSQWGEAEVTGPHANPSIASYLKSVGLPGNDETAWCSAFLHWCASNAGLEVPKEDAAAARSWLGCGQQILVPVVGDVVVMHRKDAQAWQGHVGVFVRFSRNGRSVYVLGGNQGNTVSVVAFDTALVIGYRRLQSAAAASS